MTPEQNQALAELTLRNVSMVRLLTAIVSEMLEQAANRGEFQDQAHRLRYKLKELGETLSEGEQAMQQVREEFGLT